MSPDRPLSRYVAVIPAAGRGLRLHSAAPKQYLSLAGRPMVVHAIEALLTHPAVEAVIVVIAADDPHWPTVAPLLPHNRSVWTTTGGLERCHSVYNGLQALQQKVQPPLNDTDWVLVHDAARPCLRRTDLDRLIETVRDDPVGGLLAVPVRDTLKRADDAQYIQATVDRQALWHAQTPQLFRIGLLRKALQTVLQRKEIVTDEAAAMEAMGFMPRLVQGNASNLKVTYPDDVALAEFYLMHSA